MIDFKRVRRIFLKNGEGGAVFPSEFSPSDDFVLLECIFQTFGPGKYSRQHYIDITYILISAFVRF